MELLLTASRLLLFVIFLIAGAAKLYDRKGSRQAVIDFGVPTMLASPLSVLLPLAELATALLLLPLSTAWLGALGALSLLLVFIAGIGLNLARGRTPDCHCFGQLHSAPAGRGTLARNAALAAVAGLVVWQGRDGAGLGVLDLLVKLSANQLVGAVVVAALLGLAAIEGWLLVHLIGQNGRILARLQVLEQRFTGLPSSPVQPPHQAEVGIAPGTPAPAFQLQGLQGETQTLGGLRRLGKPLILIFSDPNCGPCNALLPDIAGWQRKHSDRLTVALISRGSPEGNRAKGGAGRLRHVLLQSDREVAEAYQAGGTPMAVLVRTDGKIGSWLAAGADSIRSLINRTLDSPSDVAAARHAHAGQTGHAHHTPPSLKIGDRAPQFALPDLTGKTVRLADFKGSKTLVLFWNPDCGFCARMLEDLKAWEANPPEGAPRLLIVSTGSVEQNRAQGLRSPILLDQDFSTGRMYGIDGTPTAVLISAQQNVSSLPGAGAPGVLALAGVDVQLTTS